MALELLCRKIGMTRIFTETGESVPVTVLEAGPNRVVPIKTPERDGYSALQLRYGARRPSRTSRPAGGHFQRAGVAPQRWPRPSRGAAE